LWRQCNGSIRDNCAHIRQRAWTVYASVGSFGLIGMQLPEKIQGELRRFERRPYTNFPTKGLRSKRQSSPCIQGRRKHQKIGGAPASRGTLGYRKGHLKNFPIVAYRNCTFLTKFFKKLGNFQTKRAPLMLIYYLQRH
jgi:hypothetical protein